MGLLQIIVTQNVDLPIRQVASIYFKNVTARDWLPRDPGILSINSADYLTIILCSQEVIFN